MRDDIGLALAVLVIVLCGVLISVEGARLADQAENAPKETRCRVPWTDWSRQEPDFPTCECTDERSSSPDWMCINRGKVSPTQDSHGKRSHRQSGTREGPYRVFPLAVVTYANGTIDIGTRTALRKKLGIQNDRIRTAIEAEKPLTWRGQVIHLRNATPEEEANV